MRPIITFTVGVLVGALLTLFVLKLSHANEQPRVDTEVADLMMALEQVTHEVRNERDELRALRAALKVLTEKPATDSQEQQVKTLAFVPSNSRANSAILGYLGEPVAAPQDLDVKYSAEGLASTFRALCERYGVKIEKLGVDTSEFPYVIHGIVENRRVFDKIGEDLRAIPGYSYSGSVTGRANNDATFFSLSMTPHRTLPREHQEAVSRRLMLRLQMIAAAWQDPVPQR